jgi:segregation and condensation protein B
MSEHKPGDGSAAVVESEAEARAAESAPVLEALLLSVDRPVNAERLAEGLGLIPRREGDEDSGPSADEVRAACERVELAVRLLNSRYEETGRAFRIEPVAGGYRVMTLPIYAERIADFHRTRLSAKLTRPSIETLAIIAYKQPITRAELEAIRGVSCGEVLKSLMERRLVTVKGRAEELGRPMLYGTTKQFLDQFGLSSIKDLPMLSELKPGAEAGSGAGSGS